MRDDIAGFRRKRQAEEFEELRYSTVCKETLGIVPCKFVTFNLAESPQELFETLERLMQYAKKRCNQDWATQSDALMTKLKDALVCKTTTGQVTLTTTAPSCGENATMLGWFFCCFRSENFALNFGNFRISDS